MKSRTIIKLTFIFLLCTVVIILNLDTTFSQDSQNDYVQDSSVEETIASEETFNLDEWFKWFNSLTQEEQEKINYHPANFEETQREKYGIIIDNTPNDTLFDPVITDYFQSMPAPTPTPIQPPVRIDNTLISPPVTIDNIITSTSTPMSIIDKGLMTPTPTPALVIDDVLGKNHIQNDFQNSPE